MTAGARDPSLAERVARGRPARHRARDLARRRRGSRRRPTDPRHLRADGPCLPGRRHRPAWRGQEHARRSTDDRDAREPAPAWGSWRSIPPVLSPAAPFWAIASACRRTRPTRASSSAAWRRAATSAASSRATGDAAFVLDAAGKDVVLIETVGVGQDEVDIVRTADVSIVTLVPGTGDEVQALKAGIMEIADIFVVNKADREGADRLAAAIEAICRCMLRSRTTGDRRSSRPWRRPAAGSASSGSSIFVGPWATAR